MPSPSSPTPSSPTVSEKWFKEKKTRDARKFNPLANRLANPTNQKTPSFRYSITSDHKPVFMEFFLKYIEPETPLIALTYNMSFASDLGIAKGSERNFVQRAILADRSNPRAYWKNAANLVDYFVNEKNPTIMYFQEMNDSVRIKKTKPDFDGGYQALLELLANPNTISYISLEIPYSVRDSRLDSYYTTGTYIGGRNEQNYGFVAYSIMKPDKTFPTLLTIWNIDTLGGFDNFYGNDIGLHSQYRSNPNNLGRNFSCVTTSKGANLINLHGPNLPWNASTFLKDAIEYNMVEAANAFNQAQVPQSAQASQTEQVPQPAQAEQPEQAATSIKSWNAALTVIGGDTNDSFDEMKEIPYITTTYNYAVDNTGKAPKSCCAEFFNLFEDNYNDTLDKSYRNCGDKFLVNNPDPSKPIYLNKLYEPPEDSGIAYGGRRRFNNLKQRKTIKKKHYKLNKKKSLKKRRIIRRKTRRHKRNH